MSTASNTTAQIDPRGPRFAAGITTFVFIAVLWLGASHRRDPAIRCSLVAADFRHSDVRLEHGVGSGPPSLQLSVPGH